MSRLQLLLPLLFWAIWIGIRPTAWTGRLEGVGIYLLGLAAVVLLVRRLARRTMRSTTRFGHEALRRFHMTVNVARLVILAIHGTALFYLGLGDFVLHYVPTGGGEFQSPAIIVSILPFLLAWTGLIWAQFPLDRSIREQNVLLSANAGEPFYPMPTPWQHLLGAVRLQILFLLVPVLLAIVLRDVFAYVLARTNFRDNGLAVTVATLGPVTVIFLAAPELLRRVLPTRPLPASPGRERLTALCRRLKLRYRDILVWHTHHSLANAAVMGIIPRVRYVLLSDLLLATMNEDQVEAVFAHEAGHIVHQHMTWYVVFIVVLILALGGLHDLTIDLLSFHGLYWPYFDVFSTVAGVAIFVLLFGALSRSFERQADVFAARNLSADPAIGDVGRNGVAIFSSALTQVARMNRMPIDARPGGRSSLILRPYRYLMRHAGSWLHGSVRYRLDYLETLPGHPDRLSRFDRQMFTVRVVLLVSLCATACWMYSTMR